MEEVKESDEEDDKTMHFSGQELTVSKDIPFMLGMIERVLGLAKPT